MKQSTKDKLNMLAVCVLVLAGLCLESYWAAQDLALGF
ncbi:hypothetical protein VPHD273_0073 [Vibrio phage D273]